MLKKAWISTAEDEAKGEKAGEGVVERNAARSPAITQDAEDATSASAPAVPAPRRYWRREVGPGLGQEPELLRPPSDPARSALRYPPG